MANFREDPGGQGWARVNGQMEVTAQGQSVIQLREDVVPKHYPVISSKLSYVADVDSHPRHNGLRDLSFGHINVIAHVRAHKSIQLKAMVPEGRRGTSLNHFYGRNPALTRGYSPQRLSAMGNKVQERAGDNPLH